ncbi:nuclear transport factor 2 family protein [Flavobacterium taihuense]|uniref:Nuclear transport factor 2 family protein n=1 Tax=Flavobacterium taihuense TaxID=2857508 RepID=A0ABS6XRC4_9FLAO|nr:nuclear transport factor 2 family protein [Flavobacterium taihuense]MBW4359189.1 nuclear transport factor 2 family protein [Flavobacterium taihuense]
MKVFFLSLAALALVSFDSLQYKGSDEKEQVNRTLDAWHKAAGEAKFDVYFGMMTEDAIFIGTDPTENWDLKAFQAFAKPYFDRGKAWNFKAVERHVYFDKSGKLAWFDELLNTQMKICRGSGVLVKIGKDWKIKHYVLSMTIPNDNTNEVVKIIAPIEDGLLQKMQSK